MGVSALRATACAGVLVGCLMLGESAAGLAVADPGGCGHGRRDEGSSKTVDHERAGRAATVRRVAGERRGRHHHVAQDAPPTTFGSGRESAYAAPESDVATFSDATEPAPEPAPDTERGAGVQASPPAGRVTSMSGQTSLRQVYTEYQRTARLPQLAGAAVPGVAGILLLTFGGGVIGYRQASAGRMVRMSGAARYLP